MDSVVAESSDAPRSKETTAAPGCEPDADSLPYQKHRAEEYGATRTAELASILASFEEEFAEKKWLSEEQRWCEPISIDRKVSTVAAFYGAFHDTTTLPIDTCMICYRKYARTELQEFAWFLWVPRLVWVARRFSVPMPGLLPQRRERAGMPGLCGTNEARRLVAGSSDPRLSRLRTRASGRVKGSDTSRREAHCAQFVLWIHYEVQHP